MASGKEAKAKDARSKVRQCFDLEITHLRAGDWRGPQVEAVTFLGTAFELHGLDGQCTCCPRRTAVAA